VTGELMNKNLKESILKLRQEGKTYNEIVKLLGCSKSSVCYHCGEGQKIKHDNRQRVLRAKKHPFIRKLENFLSVPKQRVLNISHWSTNKQKISSKIAKFTSKTCNGDRMKQNFNVEDIINKFGENTNCYLTGEPIEISQPSTYQFDHIIPVSRGGDNSLDNLGICTKQANQSKYDMTPDEFINLCKRVLEYNGYTVKKEN
jgi:5-methylcytosine-specific restriction endonuclease McrA